MAITKVESYDDFIDKIKDKETAYLFVYKSGSEKSECAHGNMLSVASTMEDIDIFTVDVNNVKDIHTKYSIKSAPSLLEFNKGVYSNVVKGCHDTNFYKSLFENVVYVAKAKKEGRKINNVIVYTSPTCSWCTTLKNYLRTNNIRYREIDVSKNQKDAEAMIRKSGQQGVPQTEINGTMVVGFDTVKLNRLLGIEANR